MRINIIIIIRSHFSNSFPFYLTILNSLCLSVKFSILNSQLSFCLSVKKHFVKTIIYFSLSVKPIIFSTKNEILVLFNSKNSLVITFFSTFAPISAFQAAMLNRYATDEQSFTRVHYYTYYIQSAQSKSA